VNEPDEVREFLSYLASEKGLSGNTLSAYHQDLTDFLAFCRVKKIPWLNPTLKGLRNYLAHLRKNELSDRSIARRASALRQFYRFLLREDKIEGNPADLLTVVRKGRKLPKHLSVEEVFRLVGAAKGVTDAEVRDRALLEFWYATGCRVTEIATLKAANIDWPGAVAKILGKGGRERLVPITREAVEWGKRYQAIRHEELRRHNLKETEVFFLTRRGEGFTRQGIWKIVKQYALKAGITRNVWPHMIRHSVATHVLQGGADLRSVQELLGHRSIATTEIYTHLDPENLKVMQRKYHPRS
jgi:integrase/recombinase XerD